MAGHEAAGGRQYSLEGCSHQAGRPSCSKGNCAQGCRRQKVHMPWLHKHIQLVCPAEGLQVSDSARHLLTDSQNKRI